MQKIIFNLKSYIVILPLHIQMTRNFLINETTAM